MNVIPLSHDARLLRMLLACLGTLALLLSPGTASAQSLTLANPHWNITLTDFGYSDFLLDNTPGFEGREYLSGEWGAAVGYQVSGGPSVTAQWLEPNFVYPDWTTNSTFTVVSPITQTGLNADNLPVAQSVIANADLEITQRFEMLDTVVGTPMGTKAESAAGAGTFMHSNRYVLKQTYTVKNIAGAATSNVQLFQLLHGLNSQRGLDADRLGRELVTVSCNEDTSATDLPGRHLLLGGDTRWVDGPVTRAVRGGALLYLDEIAEARADALVVIHSLSDHRRELFLDRTGETMRAPDECMLIVSYNPGYQRSMREPKPSTRQRFVALGFGYAPESMEVEIVAGETGVEKATAQRLVQIGRKIRNLTELSLMESASTRLLVAGGRLIARGVPPRLACHSAIAEPLSDDPDALAALRQVVELTI